MQRFLFFGIPVLASIIIGTTLITAPKEQEFLIETEASSSARAVVGEESKTEPVKNSPAPTPEPVVAAKPATIKKPAVSPSSSLAAVVAVATAEKTDYRAGSPEQSKPSTQTNGVNSATKTDGASQADTPPAIPSPEPPSDSIVIDAVVKPSPSLEDLTPPTGGAEEQQPPSPPSLVPLVNPRINEVLYDAVGADGGKEFIELYNPSDREGDLDEWSLTITNGAGTVSSLAKIGGKAEDKSLIAAKGYFLIGLNSFIGPPAADVTRSASLPNSTGTIELKDKNGESKGTLVYGVNIKTDPDSGASLEWNENSGAYTIQPVPTPISGTH